MVGSADNQWFIMCWTEGETIFFTKEIACALSFKDKDDAQDYLDRVSEYAERFYFDKPEKELSNKEVKALNLMVVIAQFKIDFNHPFDMEIPW
jgi:hypothetical protein